METFCGYVLGSGPQSALRNSFIILECHFPTKWRGPTPLFWHTFTKNTFYKMTTLSTHQSPSPFHPVILTAKNQRHFVDNHLCNPICDMSLTMVWGLLTLQNGKPAVCPNNHLYKMTTWGDNQPPVTSRPFKSW